MIYFFYSENNKEGGQMVAKKAADLATTLLKKKPDASLFYLTEENWNDAVIEEYTGSQGLFSNKYIVLVKGILDGTGNAAAKKFLKESFLDKIEFLAESTNIFIISAVSIDKVTLKKIEKHAEKVQEIEGGKIEDSAKKNNSATAGASIFALGDALGERDKKTLWILYRQAIDQGKVPEEIHGILFWQLKSILIAAKTNSASEAGLNPFVFSKSKRYSLNFTALELENILGKFVSIYHDAHRGIHEFDAALERFILEY